MDPLSVRMREYIEAHPGIRKDRFIGSIVDDYHENPTDVERILQVLEKTGKIYACKVYNPALQNFMSFYYPIDAVPSFCEQEALRCSRIAPAVPRSCHSMLTISFAKAAFSTARSATIVSFRRNSDVRSDNPRQPFIFPS